MSSHFRKGSSTFICSCCGHNTRETGNQAMGSKMCSICWDLAGYENMIQDDLLQDSDAKHIANLFNEIKARSETEFAKAIKSHDLAWDAVKDAFNTDEAKPAKKATSKGKYDYPAGLTQAQKKVFRAKARRSK